jgi:hypothetical protein
MEKAQSNLRNTEVLRMIIQALVNRYHDVGGCLGWQNRFVDYCSEFDGQGAVLEIIPLDYNEGGKRIRHIYVAGGTSG